MHCLKFTERYFFQRQLAQPDPIPLQTNTDYVTVAWTGRKSNDSNPHNHLPSIAARSRAPVVPKIKTKPSVAASVVGHDSSSSRNRKHLKKDGAPTADDDVVDISGQPALRGNKRVPRMLLDEIDQISQANEVDDDDDVTLVRAPLKLPHLTSASVPTLTSTRSVFSFRDVDDVIASQRARLRVTEDKANVKTVQVSSKLFRL